MQKDKTTVHFLVNKSNDLYMKQHWHENIEWLFTIFFPFNYLMIKVTMLEIIFINNVQNSGQLTISAEWSEMVDGKINFKITKSFENTFWNRQIV